MPDKSNWFMKKSGPLANWQWIGLGVGVGAAYYIYKNYLHKETSPEEENNEGLLTPSREGGSAGGGGESGVSSPPSIPAPEPTPAPLPEGSAPLPALPPTEPTPVQSTAENQSTPSGGNNPPTIAFTPAVQAAHEGVAGADKAAGRKNVYFNTEKGSKRYGKIFKVVKKANGEILHDYQNGEKELIKASNKARRRGAAVDHSKNATKHARAKVSPVRGQHSPNIRHATAQIHHTRPVPIAHRVKPQTGATRPAPHIAGQSAQPITTVAPSPISGTHAYVAVTNRPGWYWNQEKGNPRYGQMFKFGPNGEHRYANGAIVG